MASDPKQHFIDALKAEYQQLIAGAHQAERGAAREADTIRADARTKDDSKSAVEQGRMASAHRKRRNRARRELESLIDFAAKGLPRFGRDSVIAEGALVDVRIEDDAGSEERTVFLLPVGAGSELEGPGGDGFVQVITPASPVGRQLVGAKIGHSFEIVVDDHDREWTVVDIW